jgi:hypothetical protein
LGVVVDSSVVSSVAWLGQNTVGALTVGIEIFHEAGPIAEKNEAKENHLRCRRIKLELD